MMKLIVLFHVALQLFKMSFINTEKNSTEEEL